MRRRPQNGFGIRRLSASVRRLCPSPRLQSQNPEPQSAHDKSRIRCLHRQPARPWSRTSPHKAGACPRPAGSGLQPELGGTDVFFPTTAQKVHLSILPRSPACCSLRILRCAERACIEAITTADAEILGVQDHTRRSRKNNRPGTPPCRVRRSNAYRPPR